MKTQYIISLLELLAIHENESLDHRGFGKMSEAICKKYAKKNGTSEDVEVVSLRYLYDLYRKSKKKLEKGIDHSSPRNNKIDIIARHLDYPAFRQYEALQESKVSSVLKSCTGNWWSYVRANAGEVLFKAPVNIQLDPLNNKVFIELRSKGRTFTGEVYEDSGSMTSLLDSGSGKKLALVFKLGNSTSIECLQGVFCGISSAGDPISGREILVRETRLDYEEMQWSQLSLKDETTDPRILNYFSEYGQNCIKIRGVSSFNLTDLEPVSF